MGVGLEDFGASASNVIDFFPEDAYRLYCRADDDAAFRLMSRDQDLPAKRFFLVALAE